MTLRSIPLSFISFSNLNFNHSVLTLLRVVIIISSDHFASVFFSHVRACSANTLAKTTTGKRRMGGVYCNWIPKQTENLPPFLRSARNHEKKPTIIRP